MTLLDCVLDFVSLFSIELLVLLVVRLTLNYISDQQQPTNALTSCYVLVQDGTIHVIKTLNTFFKSRFTDIVKSGPFLEKDSVVYISLNTCSVNSVNSVKCK